ncbi:hypothetical protein MHTCC0001_00050 [Flavobacteriaceae bacterium MHTCC 0001]
MNKALNIIFRFLCICIGLYLAIYIIFYKYLFLGNRTGFLSTKTPELLNDVLWNILFFGHIILGGVALLMGWIQFIKRIRIKRPELHKGIGKIYVISVLISGTSGLYIAFFATGGIICTLGFILLALIWLVTTILSYSAIKQGDVERHSILMIYSYAACFAAVTLRIWLPVLIMVFKDFIFAYRIVAWLSWVPNIVVAYVIVAKTRRY